MRKIVSVTNVHSPRFISFSAMFFACLARQHADIPMICSYVNPHVHIGLCVLSLAAISITILRPACSLLLSKLGVCISADLHTPFWDSLI